jgi:hypothetical protein
MGLQFAFSAYPKIISRYALERGEDFENIQHLRYTERSFSILHCRKKNSSLRHLQKFMRFDKYFEI